MYIYILTCKNIMNVMNVIYIYIYLQIYTILYTYNIFFSTPQSLMMIPSKPGVFTQQPLLSLFSWTPNTKCSDFQRETRLEKPEFSG